MRLVDERVRGLSWDELHGTDPVRPLVPAYVTVADGPWLSAVVEERERYVGKPRRLWRVRCMQPWKVSAPAAKLRMVLRVLDRLGRGVLRQPMESRALRERLFRAANSCEERSVVIRAVAEEFRLTEHALLQRLFADLPYERELTALPGNIGAIELALLCNERLVYELLQRALRVRIEARGQTRAVVRHAKWMGLLCVLVTDPSDQRALLEVSGPYALFKHTRLYGHALASLVPRLARCDAYRLEADCVHPETGEIGRLVLKTNDPIHPARELPAYDSRLEERFARDFAKLALDWDVIREPAPIAAGSGWCFPDFMLRHRGTGETYWLEIVGFWTADYLRKKLQQLRAAALPKMILCVDDARCCDADALDGLGTVIRFRRRIDPVAVLSIVEPSHPLVCSRGNDHSA